MVSGQMMLKTLLTLLASLSQKFWFGVQSPLLVSLQPSYCQADDDDVYIIKCFPKMVKFIEKHHKNDETIFWPDLALRHYAKISKYHRIGEVTMSGVFW
jgi:hypothetical protein